MDVKARLIANEAIDRAYITKLSTDEMLFIILPLTLKFNNSFTASMILATISTIFAYWIFTLMLNKIGINF